MSFVSSSDTITIKAYLTQKGKQLYFNGDDKDIIVKYVTFGDDDANYFISSSIKLDDTPNRLSNGFVPDLSGDDERCIYNLANGVDIKNKIRISSYKKGDIVNQFCQPPYTLIQEISNGDGTTYFTKIENSIDCGFRYKSNVFSRSFTKQTCTGSSVGQSYTVTTTYGQFTGLTQTEADNKAINYLNVSGQTIANNLGSCMFMSTTQERIFEKNNCPNGGRPYVVTTNAGQFTSLISQIDANNKALIWLDTNGQTIANQNGSCKTLVNTSLNLLYNPSSVSVNRSSNQNTLFDLRPNNTLIGGTSDFLQPFPPFGQPYTLYLRLSPDNINGKNILIKVFGNKPYSFGQTEQLSVIVLINGGNITPITNYSETILTQPNQIGYTTYQLDINIDNVINNQIVGIHFNTVALNILLNYNYRIEVYEKIDIYN